MLLECRDDSRVEYHHTNAFPSVSCAVNSVYVICNTPQMPILFSRVPAWRLVHSLSHKVYSSACVLYCINLKYKSVIIE